MKHLIVLCVPLLICAALLAQQSASKSDPLVPLRILVGEWCGTTYGQPGNGIVERSFAFTLNDRFLQVHNTSTYPPQEKNKAGEKHQDMGMISYDRARKRFVYRQFHTEGFVNTYVQQDSDDPKKVVFVSESIENIPARFRAKETWTIGADEFVERFELAEPGKDFELYSESHLKRAK